MLKEERIAPSGWAEFQTLARSISDDEEQLVLMVVVVPDHRTPVVTHMLWYRIGAADDPFGKSGIAHFLEHLMFKGTAKNPAGRFSQQLATIGGLERLVKLGLF